MNNTNINTSQTYFTIQQVCARFGVQRTTLWSWQKKNLFPKPRVFGQGLKRFHIEDLLAFEQSKKAGC